jgi:hypothetical protein
VTVGLLLTILTQLGWIVVYVAGALAALMVCLIGLSDVMGSIDRWRRPYLHDMILAGGRDFLVLRALGKRMGELRAIIETAQPPSHRQKLRAELRALELEYREISERVDWRQQAITAAYQR